MARKTNNKRKSNPRRKRRPQPRKYTQEQAYARMVADPCNGPMLEGFYSSAEGMLNKLKTTYGSAQTVSNGYILWDPSFTSSVDDPGSFNCLFVASTNSSDHPSNNGANPLGSSLTDLKLEVGAGPFCQSATVSDARCVGACLRATYTGRMDASSGIIAVIDNIPAEAVLNGSTTVSVDELIALSSVVERANLATLEVKYKPSDYSHVFRTNSEGLFDFTTGIVTTISDEAERSGAHLMGFAFKGVTSMADFIFEFHQNIEWRPNVDSGFISKVPRQLKSAGHSSEVIKYLDNHHPNWWTNVKGMASSTATSLAQAAFTGSLPRMLQSAESFAARRAMPYLAEAAPLLLTL